jgi:hypothetical protein
MIAYPAQPVYSFPGKSKDPKNCTDVPGPGNYSPPTMFQTVQKGYSFGGGDSRAKRLSIRKASPGPGQYTIDGRIKLLKNAPAFGFGSDKRDKNNIADDPLGPGSYRSKSSFDKAMQRKSFKLTSQRP